MAAQRLPLAAVALALAGCAAASIPPPGPVVTRIVVAERGWHTDVCVRAEDADAWLLALSRGFAGVRFLCLGFGERQFVVNREQGLGAMVLALLPSRAALLLTVLRDTPAAAFGEANVVSLGLGRAGLAGLAAFLRRATQTDAAGAPLRLAEGPYPGSVFFAATGTYDGLYTCNTWTADAVRAAGLPVGGAVLFAGDVMRQVRRVAAAQSAAAP